jgi:hypothetical protein
MTAEESTPASFKIAGAVSIGSWLAVLYFGRMLPFLGNTFSRRLPSELGIASCAAFL